ncbi:MAG TPA: hypothetical protein DCQ04_06700, partial [Actinobacteria bacterium]|nr:hypothetical protein [Actinomycetota bacterium]
MLLAGAMRMPLSQWSRLGATLPMSLAFQVYKNITFTDLRCPAQVSRADGGAPGKAFNAIGDAKSQFRQSRCAARRDQESKGT